MRKKITYSKYYNEKDFQEKLSDCVIPLVEAGDFWWQEVLNFFIGYYEYRSGADKNFLYFKDLENLIQLPFFPINAKDRGGNTLSKALIYLNKGHGEHKFMFFEDDINKILDLTPNALDYNLSGESAFWHLNDIVFTLAQPHKKLTPIIEKYNIDIFHKNKNGDNLLDKAVYDREEFRIEYYVSKGLSLSNNFSNFMFHRNINQAGVCCDLFKEQMQKYNVFTQKIKKGNSCENSLIDLWIKFSEDNSQDYVKNLLAIIRYHVKEQLAHVHLQDIQRAINKMENIEGLKERVQPLKIEFEKLYLNEYLEKNNSNLKIVKI